MINESLADNIMAYSILKAVVQPYSKMDAYKLGLIDKRGKRIRKAKTPEEKRAMNSSNRIILNIKRLLDKVLGGSKTSKLLITGYLLKENYQPNEAELIAETINRHFHVPVYDFIEESEDGINIERFITENLYTEEDLIDV